MSIIYRLAIGIYHLLIRWYARLGNAKAKAWVAGRREPIEWSKLEAARHKGPTVWMHCASLGEWEQGRPVLEALHRSFDGALAIVLTFYSPSGFEKAKLYAGADLVTYLPQDGPTNARAFQAALKPDLALFVKYEFWHFHLKELTSRGVPIVLVAGAFRSGQPFFLKWGAWWRDMLDRFQLLLVQTQQDRALLDKLQLPPERAVVSGDPRVDRTLELATQDWSDPIISAFAQGEKPLLIVGSAWSADIQRLRGAWPALQDHFKLLIAPHEITKQHVFDWSRAFKAQRYTQIKKAEDITADAIILDTVGMLSRVYRYGHLALIGGGFGAGIHNTLEPMAYGLPVLFGPRIHKFREALTMVEAGGAFTFETPDQLRDAILELVDTTNYKLASEQVKVYMGANKGATERSVEAILAVWQ
ncbi:MAG: glycosyltransferase N-terminal domain-containing protein [Bacteroidota bacterium]